MMATAWAWERNTTQSEMDSGEQRSALRAAVYRSDGRAVVDLLRGVGADDDALQLAGDGVIAAVMQRVDGAAGLAREFVVALRRRGWDGDDELADQLEAQLGSRPAAMLRALPVDLDEPAGILEGDPLSVGAASISGPVRCGLGQRSAPQAPGGPPESTRCRRLIATRYGS